jgi:chromosome segregation ATPase
MSDPNSLGSNEEDYSDISILHEGDLENEVKRFKLNNNVLGEKIEQKNLTFQQIQEQLAKCRAEKKDISNETEQVNAKLENIMEVKKNVEKSLNEINGKLYKEIEQNKLCKKQLGELRNYNATLIAEHKVEIRGASEYSKELETKIAALEHQNNNICSEANQRLIEEKQELEEENKKLGEQMDTEKKKLYALKHNKNVSDNRLRLLKKNINNITKLLENQNTALETHIADLGGARGAKKGKRASSRRGKRASKRTKADLAHHLAACGCTVQRGASLLDIRHACICVEAMADPKGSFKRRELETVASLMGVDYRRYRRKEELHAALSALARKGAGRCGCCRGKVPKNDILW